MDKMQNAVQLSQNALRECRMQDPSRVFYASYGVNQTHTVTRLSLNRHFGFCILHYMQNAHPFPLRDTTLHFGFWILDFGFSTLGPPCDTTLHSAFWILDFGFPTSETDHLFAQMRRRPVVVANSPTLTVESLTAVLGESNGISELSAMPIAQQLSSETRFNVVPAHCCGRRWLHQSIIIFAYAASCCLESAFVMNRPQLHRSV